MRPGRLLLSVSIALVAAAALGLGFGGCAAPGAVAAGGSGETGVSELHGESAGVGDAHLESEPVRVAAPAEAPSRPLLLSATAGRTLLPPGQAIELPVVVRVWAQPLAVRRPALDVALVFDRSGSMADAGKLDFTLAAARLVVSNLSERDAFSLVTFADQATVLSPHQPARRYLTHWFDCGIPARGMTNLSAGLLAGLDQLRKKRRSGTVARLVVLSDGVANRGVTSRDALARIARAAAKDQIAISTIGVGVQADRRTLSMLAEAGGGRYVHVARAEQIPSAVSRETDGLLPTIAQNVTLRILPAEGVIVTRVGDGVEADLPLGDLLPGEQRTVFLNARVPAFGGAAPRPLLTARLDYQAPYAGGRSRSVEVKVDLPVAASAAASARTRDPEILGVTRLAEILDLVRVALASQDREIATRARRSVGAFRRRYADLERVAEDPTTRETLTLLAHYEKMLGRLAAGGGLHGHRELAAARRDAHYRGLLLRHHRKRTGGVSPRRETLGAGH